MQERTQRSQPGLARVHDLARLRRHPPRSSRLHATRRSVDVMQRYSMSCTSGISRPSQHDTSAVYVKCSGRGTHAAVAGLCSRKPRSRKNVHTVSSRHLHPCVFARGMSKPTFAVTGLGRSCCKMGGGTHKGDLISVTGRKVGPDGSIVDAFLATWGLMIVTRALQIWHEDCTPLAILLCYIVPHPEAAKRMHAIMETASLELVCVCGLLEQACINE